MSEISSGIDRTPPNHQDTNPDEAHRPVQPVRALRVACVIHSLDGGGAERVMAGLASRLAQRGHQVTLVTLDAGQNDRHPVSKNVRRVSLDVLSTQQRPVSLFKRLRTMRHEFARGEYDVVLSFCDWTNVSVLLATIGMANRPPIVISERSDPAFQRMGTVREWLRRRTYPHATKVVCLSSDIGETLNQQTGTVPIVIPSAVEAASHVRSPPPYAREPVRLIAMGRLENEKGFDRLLHALAKLKSDPGETHWTLAILGDGSQGESLRSLANQLGIADQVEFAGWVSPVSPRLVQSDIFVLPSRYEGFPSAMLEAMAAGVAVVAVDAGGAVRDTLVHGQNGWLVPNETEALSEGLRIVLDDWTLRERMSKNGPTISRKLSWPRMVDEYERVLSEAVHDHC